MVTTANDTRTALPQSTGFESSVYGPVKSWRFGWSLGIDLIRDISTCSFNCIYCQLGNIQVKTMARQCFVPTATVMADLAKADWAIADVITLSGSGEPTLALNCGEAIQAIKAFTHKPVMVLTNGTLLWDEAVQNDLRHADHVAIKLDAATEDGLRQMNRPVDGVTLERIIEGAQAFRQRYTGKLSIQSMIMPTNMATVADLAELINRIGVDEVQLNTPKRPYPLSWHVESRGNHVANPDYPTVALKTISETDAVIFENLLREKTGVPILSVYQNQQQPSAS